MSDAPAGFDAMKARLDEIADEVSAEGISLDDALALYEEAVRIGLAACDVSEADVLAAADEEAEGEAAEGAPDAGAPDGASAPSSETAPAENPAA